jgi:hypothetical protein
MPAILLGFLGTAFRWLLAGMAGRILLSFFTQGIVVACTLFWGGEIAEWAFGKMLAFVKATDFWSRLTTAFSAFGDLPDQALQFLGCIGMREAIVALISGQISGIGVALICRKLL